MTTIDEMDEFFNIHDATHSLVDRLDYDIDLPFADPEGGENSFTCLQHFSAPEAEAEAEAEAEEQPSQHFKNGLLNTSTLDISTLEAHDFLDFPRWIDGMSEPTKPCTRCRQENTHSLARSCSLTRDLHVRTKKPYDYRSSGKIDGAADGQGNHDISEGDTASPPINQCEHCRACAQPCKILGHGENIACQSCVWLSRPCSLVQGNPSRDWQMGEGHTQGNPLISPMSLLESRNNSSTDLPALRTSTENLKSDPGANSPKVGARFSRQSVRILKDWLGLHHRHPYPTDSEREVLMSKTGLNKTQITNWLANARRRGKSRPTITPHTVGNYANAMDIPRKATPALEHMNPLERWKHSPPEHEPASATAIAKAVTASSFDSGMESPYTSYADDGSNRSLYNMSSASSLGTSHSSAGSFASAYSHRSRGSFGSFGSFGNKGRRRRRQAPKPAKAMAAGPARIFQCTFCTESFKTKHDWQRHEKSLHLSLERWVCCPNGPIQYNKEYERPACVYCDHPNPPASHAEVHNHSSCAEKVIGERTFYRKDHLRQHLNLVHDVKFASWSMESWKAITPEIRSRCGFCGIVMDSWTARVDHLADHFRSGRSMADWRGDWGFEPQILNIVENGIPPYLIHDERNTMQPYEASQVIFNGECTPENLIKNGLIQYVNDKVTQGITPTDEELLAIARQIIRNLDAVSDGQNFPDGSWLRDLILFSGSDSCEQGTDEQDVLGMLRTKTLDTIQYSLIGGTQSTCRCPKERALRNYVTSKQMLGLIATDYELQVEACRILDAAELTAAVPCKGAVSWFKYLIKDSTCWLADFRRRAGLPRSSEMTNEGVGSKDETSIDHAIHNYARLEAELKKYVQLQSTLSVKLSDSDLQRHARLIVYGSDDQWNQTWADDPLYLHIFKTRNGLAPAAENQPSIVFPTAMDPPKQAASSPSRTLHWELENIEARSRPGSQGTSPNTTHNHPIQILQTANQPSANSNPAQSPKYFINDAGCYNRLVRELSRFVARCMSPNNPNQHIPTDAELQNQARLVIYNDDDPWNQTAADNAEWLMRFKCDAGLSPRDSGPGLPTGNSSWKVSLDGTGLSPPYLNPGKNVKACDTAEELEVKIARVDESEKLVTLRGETANGYIKSLKQRYKMPAQVFWSRELEEALIDLVKTENEQGRIPTDESLRARARDVLNVPNTAADDGELLEKFKTHYGIPLTGQQRSSPHSPTQTDQPQAQSIASFSTRQPPTFLHDEDLLASFDEELLHHADMGLGGFHNSQPPVMNFLSNHPSSALGPIGGSCLVSTVPFIRVPEGAIMDFDTNMNLGLGVGAGAGNNDAECWDVHELNALDGMEGIDENVELENRYL
ncbi:hypothetical protein DSL72_004469 [Monilinia vaccinii-corymbosi]|uniref:Homeobox domain-containing protein n=1 Tax=Monilinia vaccinii-corymbosi TaxID=61207 RepID=A0A8A3P4P5_9HELO|nr:hypothetical protein DSL72_004469 [Monilinia vaccinii-corymbosi]